MRFGTTFGAKFLFAVEDFDRKPNRDSIVDFLIFSHDSSNRLNATKTTHLPTSLGSPFVSKYGGLASIQKESLVLDGSLLYSLDEVTPIPRIGNRHPPSPAQKSLLRGNAGGLMLFSFCIMICTLSFEFRRSGLARNTSGFQLHLQI